MCLAVLLQLFNFVDFFIGFMNIYFSPTFYSFGNKYIFCSNFRLLSCLVKSSLFSLKCIYDNKHAGKLIIFFYYLIFVVSKKGSSNVGSQSLYKLGYFEVWSAKKQNYHSGWMPMQHCLRQTLELSYQSVPECPKHLKLSWQHNAPDEILIIAWWLEMLDARNTEVSMTIPESSKYCHTRLLFSGQTFLV